MNYYNLLTKKSLYNIPHRKLPLSNKHNSKTRKEHALIKGFFQKGSTTSLYCKDIILLHQRSSEAAVSRCFTKQGFLKFRKFHRKMPVLKSFFNKVAGLDRLQNKCFSMKFVKISGAPFLQNDTFVIERVWRGLYLPSGMLLKIRI